MTYPPSLLDFERCLMTTITLNEVEQLANCLPPHQQLQLIRHLTLQLAATTPRAVQKPCQFLEGRAGRLRR